MEAKDYIEANRQAWNEVAPIHASQNQQRLLESFKTSGFSCLDEIETEKLNKIGIQGKSVAQLSCNNGIEILSIKNLGASRCVGFDISDEFINQAREIAQTGKIDCEFACTNVYDIPNNYNNNFDLVYISVGVLSWMPDLNAFFSVAARLLRPGGNIFIYESHPFLDMLEPGKRENPLKICHSYFKKDPYIDTTGLDYYGNAQYESKPQYSFHYKISDIINELITNGIDIAAFDEYERDISNIFTHLEDLETKPPLSFILIGKKR